MPGTSARSETTAFAKASISCFLSEDVASNNSAIWHEAIRQVRAMPGRSAPKAGNDLD